MATLTVNINTPLPNAVVGDIVSTSGSLFLEGGTIVSFDEVTVQFGANGESKTATLNLGAWQATGRVSSGAIGGQQLTISVFATATYVPPGFPTSETDIVFGSGSVVVTLAETPPELTVDNFPTEVTPPSLPFRLQLRGTAQDAGSGVSVVQYKINNGAFANVDNLSGNWSQWAKAIDLFPGEHSLEIQAKDTHQTSTSRRFTISVRTAFQPPSPELAFAPTTYLQELMAFAERRVRVGTTGAGPKAQDLAGRFFQPFNRINQPAFFERVTRPRHQSRIAVEVLRGRLRQIGAPVPPVVEQRFRRAAYESLVLELGASFEELRAARIANAATRRALAERLGIGTGSARLDQITLVPDQVTEAQLEQLFGFAGTTSDDPLRPELPAGQVLNWRLSATQDRWLLEDALARGGANGPLPIIDPDLVREANLLTTTAGDRVYDLWKARKDYLAQRLATAEAQRPQGFEQVIRTFIGNLDLAALAAQDAAGADITSALGAVNLDLDAFRFLARSRELAATGALLDTEWQDILAIVVQVQKKRQYQQWRTEESGVSLSPQYFRLPKEGDGSISNPTILRWRASWRAYASWRKTLDTRIKQLQEVKDYYQSALDATEARAMPGLRDSLIELLGARQTPPENLSSASERLSRELSINLRANGPQQTTRVNQAIETLQGAIFSVRAGRLTTGSPSTDWSISDEAGFDREWIWMSTYQTWRAAMTVFAYPESQLYPNLFVTEEPFLKPTKSFLGLIATLGEVSRLTPALAREKAAEYLSDLRGEPGVSLLPELGADAFVITEQLDLIARKQLVTKLFNDAKVTQPHKEPVYLLEIFWLAPIALALRLQKAGHFLAALDWYQTVFAFDLPPQNRKIYRGLELEGGIGSTYDRVPEWLLAELNPHIFARKRKNAYTRFTVLSIARCCLEFADAEFSRGAAESVGRARTLYETAQDLLNLSDMKPETGPFIQNPIWESLRLHADTNLAKIHQGLNIAGMPIAMPLTNGSAPVVRPSQYRYAALVERAKQLVGIAQQVESAFLAALERLDTESYNLLQAGHDLRVAHATVSLQDFKIADADLSVQIAQLQQDKTQTQFEFYDQQLQAGLSGWEIASLAAMGTAAYLQTAAGVVFSTNAGLEVAKAALTFGILGDPAGAIGQALSAFSNAASLAGGIAQAEASFERREQEWRHQRSLSEKDVTISGAQILLAQNQKQTALLERRLAGLQLDHAGAVADFLANKFTNVELFEWMSGVLGRVYSYFLQQATAFAQLAQSQLAFERQEPALSVIQSDYWQVTPDESLNGGTNGSAPDRRGLTGSARLLQDLFQLDQYAFETKQRKLQLTQTLSLAQLAPMEMQTLRETGKVIFVTPMELFDRGFPGHYLRQIRRARVSVVALIPPTQGVRATLANSGLSRIVTGGETFETVQARRSPETIAFTSPNNATGLFELEPDGELLLPFEGMGVDTFWEFQLPKAANPFDYRAIADVVLTIEYTALFSPIYQRQVIKQLDRSASGDRMFSLRNQFADAWYDLNNPDAVEDVAQRMVANFSTERDDFPPHIEDLSIGQVTLLVSRRDGFTEEINIDGLTFTPEGEAAPIGGAARTVSGIVGTRRPNGATWLGMLGKSPVGAWKLRLPNTAPVRTLFKEEKIEDIALVVTFDGAAPAWPV